MIDLYTWTTPNGRKVSIMLEELGVPYTTHAIDITSDEQFSEHFLSISPNNKIPAIVDHDTDDRSADITLMESGAILWYLADKYDRFLPTDPATRWQCMEWLMWQMGGLGPMAGQAHHFLQFNPGKAPYAEKRYHDEVTRLYGVLDRRLADRDCIVGDYSIADMAVWPWISRFQWQQIELAQFPNVQRWYAELARRPAVVAGYDVPHVTQPIPMP